MSSLMGIVKLVLFSHIFVQKSRCTRFYTFFGGADVISWSFLTFGQIGAVKGGQNTHTGISKNLALCVMNSVIVGAGIDAMVCLCQQV